MMEIPFSSLAPKNVKRLKRSAIIPRVYMSVEKFEMDSAVNAIVYTVETGIQKGDVVYLFRTKHRYSALLEFDEQIRKIVQGSQFLKPFPPKKAFGNTDFAFLNDRAKQLQKYLSHLVQVAGIVTTKPFIKTFQINARLLEKA
jgi:hypothetical protein